MSMIHSANPALVGSAVLLSQTSFSEAFISTKMFLARLLQFSKEDWPADSKISRTFFLSYLPILLCLLG